MRKKPTSYIGASGYKPAKRATGGLRPLQNSTGLIRSVLRKRPPAFFFLFLFLVSYATIMLVISKFSACSWSHSMISMKDP